MKRLWRLQPQDGGESHGTCERRALATSVLKRLQERELEGLVQAAEAGGRDTGPCCRLPQGRLRLGRRGVQAPQVVCAQVLRWPEVTEEEMERVGVLCGERGQGEVCCNPWHWARRLETGREHIFSSPNTFGERVHIWSIRNERFM